MTLLDCHSHRPAPYPEGIVCAAPKDFHPLPKQTYSLGLHPWVVGEEWEKDFNLLAVQARREEVLAIGEAGLDSLRGAPMALQILAFKSQARLAMELGKPLIIHDVKCHEAILAILADLRPENSWIIHGFRGKPQVARMFWARGIYLSFGEKFNSQTVKEIPSQWLLAETDESPLPISSIISSLSKARGEDLSPLIASNMLKLFPL